MSMDALVDPIKKTLKELIIPRTSFLFLNKYIVYTTFTFKQHSLNIHPVCFSCEGEILSYQKDHSLRGGNLHEG